MFGFHRGSCGESVPEVLYHRRYQDRAIVRVPPSVLPGLSTYVLPGFVNVVSACRNWSPRTFSFVAQNGPSQLRQYPRVPHHGLFEERRQSRPKTCLSLLFVVSLFSTRGLRLGCRVLRPPGRVDEGFYTLRDRTPSQTSFYSGPRPRVETL